MDERKLLAACVTDRGTFNTIDKFIKKEDLSDRGHLVWEAIVHWYKTDDLASSIDREVLADQLALKFPSHAQMFKTLVTGLESISPANTIEAFIDFRLASLAQRLAQALAAGDSKSAHALMEEYRELRDAREEALKDGTRVLIGASSDRLIQSVRPDNLLKLYPANLNAAIDGGLPEGAHVLVFAPPEVGKSMLCINMAAGIMSEGHKVLYLGNEDPAELMLLRFKSRLSGMTRKEIIADPAEADRRADQRGFGNLVFASLAPGNLHDVAHLCDEHKPRIVFIDQLSNLYVKNLTKVEGLEYLAKGIRNIAKSRKIVAVSVTQAADSAIGKLFLEMGDVYFSNIAIQAQVDLMIGMGMDNQAQQLNKRVLSLCKNKLTGNHLPLEVKVDQSLTKVTPGDTLFG